MTLRSYFSWVLGLLWKAGGGSGSLGLLSCVGVPFLKKNPGCLLESRNQEGRPGLSSLLAELR